MLDIIRKFGLEHCDLPTMLWNVSVLWKPLMLNIDRLHTRRTPAIFYVLATVMSLSYVYVYTLSVAWFVFIKSSETRDIITILLVFSLGVASHISPYKLVSMYLNKEKIRDLVQIYLKYNSIQIPKSRFARNIQKTLRIVKKRAITYWLVIIFNGIAYCMKPAILPGRHLMEDSFVYFGLEPMDVSPNYEIALCISTFAILFTVYLPANITALLIITSGYIESQMLALSDEIKCLWEDAEKHIKTKSINITEINYNETNEYVRRELIEIVKIHTVNIYLVKKTENMFRDATAMGFVLLTIALVSALLAGLENTYIVIPFSLMQVTMDCFIGQKLMDASAIFENAVYDSKWENFNNANRKTVLLMLQNFQRTLMLSAGGVSMLSFASLKSVLKSIYSFYTALRSVLK